MTDIDLPQKCFCRLCAKYELCTNIYSGNGMRQLLALKISTCLPIQVHKGDTLTKGVCPSCIVKLNTAYELITTCVLVQSKLEEVANCRTISRNGHEEVTSSVMKPLPQPTNETTPGSVIVLPLTVDNVAQFNKLSTGTGSVLSKEASPPIPVISSVLTLASGPPGLGQALKHDPGPNVSDDEERPKKKERKTVCSVCKQWFPRSKIKDHETSHYSNEGSLQKGCQI